MISIPKVIKIIVAVLNAVLPFLINEDVESVE